MAISVQIDRKYSLELKPGVKVDRCTKIAHDWGDEYRGQLSGVSVTLLVVDENQMIPYSGVNLMLTEQGQADKKMVLGSPVLIVALDV